MKSFFMKALSSLNVSQTVKIGLIVIAVYGTIALITYLVW
jgi:hypothetical protein